MKIVVQRVKRASVKVDGVCVGEIDQGFVLLVGFFEGDTLNDLEWCVSKIINLRVFDDEAGKMNLSLKQIQGKILSVSQFTLAGDVRKSNRPSFTQSMDKSLASEYYQRFNDKLREKGCHVETGVFQAQMEVQLVNDGPVTILVESSGR